jgi:uncharacterized membrane protein
MLIGSMSALWLAAAVFIGWHLIPSTPLRPLLLRVFGQSAYLGIFSLAAGAALLWLAIAYAHAPIVELWRAFPTLRVVPLAVMPLALVLLVCGYTTRNPTAVMQEKHFHAPDPAPGILKVTRHPIMWAIALWALSHLVTRSDLASLILFGSLTALALIGMPLMDERRAEHLGPLWGTFALTTSAIPFLAAIEGRTRISLREIGWWRIGLGLALYAAFLALHASVIGVAPWP